MESRLPKPSGLKRPAFRAMVPSDRLGTSSSGALSTTNAAPPTQHRPMLKHPLTVIDTHTNVPTAQAKKRQASPDFHPKIDRSKIRRSRSAHDLRAPQPGDPAARPFVAELSLGSMAQKLSKSTTSLRTANAASGTAAKPRVGVMSRQTTTTFNRPAAFVAAKNALTVKRTAVSAAPKQAPCAKKIPAYDYKARFQDLQERHKLIKEKYDAAQEQMNEFHSISDQFEESQNKLISCQDQLKNAEINTECLRQQISHQEIKLGCLTKSVTEKLEEVRRLKEECDRLQTENSKMKPELLELRQKYAQVSSKNDEMEIDLRETQESLFRSNMDRKELHNVVMDLRGNIRVFCRVRPPLDTEEQKVLCGWQYLDESSVEISSLDNPVIAAGGRKTQKHEFSFDQVFHPRSSQEDIFELVSPLIQSALDGYNVCIFAYGQTGSGKTFTMDGVSDNIGIIPRTVDLLFDCIRNYKRLGWEYTIQVTFLEIYNEVLYDLLSNEQKDMDIRMVSAKSPTEIYVSNITEITVQSATELREYMRVAKSNRATASTVGNERSSRSHAVTRLQLVGTHRAKSETSIGTINLVDLAGSESPKTSTRMEETKKINKSLSELTNVIMALMQRQEHIPYRNSKLTHLLMPCLGGNSKTLMFINVAPFQDCFVESVKSLRFAASVNSCKMSKAKRNKYLHQSGSTNSTENSSNSSLNV